MPKHGLAGSGIAFYVLPLENAINFFATTSPPFHLNSQDGRIRHSLHHVCLDVSGGSNVVLRKCDDSQTQKWRFTSYLESERTKNAQAKIL